MLKADILWLRAMSTPPLAIVLLSFSVRACYIILIFLDGALFPFFPSLIHFWCCYLTRLSFSPFFKHSTYSIFPDWEPFYILSTLILFCFDEELNNFFGKLGLLLCFNRTFFYYFSSYTCDFGSFSWYLMAFFVKTEILL